MESIIPSSDLRNRYPEVSRRCKESNKPIYITESSGKPMPQSTTIISFPYSITVMFLPISAIPPRGIILSLLFSGHQTLSQLQVTMQARKEQ